MGQILNPPTHIDKLSLGAATAASSALVIGSNVMGAGGTPNNTMQIANPAGNCSAVLGQSSTARLIFLWTYNATEASAYGIITTTGTIGSVNPLILQSNGGNVGVGSGSTPSSKLTIFGGSLNLAAFTVATLPGSPVAGDVARVTDALAPTLSAAVVGGGAIPAIVWYTGSSWHVVAI